MNVQKSFRVAVIALIAAAALQLEAGPVPTHAARTITVTVHVREINNQYAFAPAKIVVQPGTKVTWINNSDAPHTVTGTRGWSYSSKMFTQTHKVSATFKKAGTFHYICSIHPYMKGVVVVRG